MPKPVSNQVIIRQRLHNQQITRTKFSKPEEIVSYLCAVQAQDYYGAKWGIGLRLPGSTDSDIEQAIANKKIVRSWVPRNTLHFVASEDLRWMLRLIKPRLIAASALRYKQLELDDKILTRCNKLLSKALKGSNQLTREEITGILGKAGIHTTGVRLSHIVQRAGFDEILCYGVRRDKQFTYTLLDEWVPESRILAKDEALAELAKRYFVSRGPATLHDFIWWSGLNAGDARAALEFVKSQLLEEKFEGKTYWWNEGGVRSQEKGVRKKERKEKALPVFLLPGFDEYLVGYKDRTAIVDPINVKYINNGGGLLSPTIIVNGRVAGIWKREIKKGKVTIKATTFLPLNNTQHELLVKATINYGKYLGMNAELTYITPQSHNF